MTYSRTWNKFQLSPTHPHLRYTDKNNFCIIDMIQKFVFFSTRKCKENPPKVYKKISRNHIKDRAQIHWNYVNISRRKDTIICLSIQTFHFAIISITERFNPYHLTKKPICTLYSTYSKWDLKVFTTPYIHSFIISSHFKKILPICSKQPSRHSGRSKWEKVVTVKKLYKHESQRSHCDFIWSAIHSSVF